MENTNKNEYKITLKKIWIHLSTICKHKYWVLKYCHMCGITWQGIKHDLSKFSPTEFWTNVKYAIPGKSPIDVQKELFGFSMAWQHHKGNNPHHYEFWMDKFDDGCYVTRMPYKYVVEMLCDNLAAGRAYSGKKYSYSDEWKWWLKQRTIRNMHPDNRDFMNICFEALLYCEANPGGFKQLSIEHHGDDTAYTAKFIGVSCIEKDILNKDALKQIYDIAFTEDRPMQMRIKDGGVSKWDNV